VPGVLGIVPQTPRAPSFIGDEGLEFMDDFFSATKSGKVCDLSDLLDATTTEYLRDCIAGGALVSVGTTRDGGACSVTVTHDGEFRREYFTDSEEIHSFLKAAAEAVAGRGRSLAGSRGGRSRK
jgi:hypothetical protein